MRDRLLVIYTDLDGTLLDAETYAWEAARPALEAVRRHRALVIPCSSKTRAEMEPLLRELGMRVPFIVENGGAIYLPRAEFTDVASGGTPVGDSEWVRLVLGTSYSKLRACLADLKRRLSVPVVGWGDLTPGEIAQECGLSCEEAKRAAQREFDEPFRVASGDPEVLSQIEAVVAAHGLRLTRGGRYFHLLGPTDKGRAVRALTALFYRRFRSIFTVGIGDSENDIPMLWEVDLPILVRRPSGEPDPVAHRSVPHARITSEIGPAGWNEAVLRVLAEEG